MDDEHLRTAQALQRITDRGKFELLVADVLWIAEPRYRCLITTGVNANGEPVRGVVDGFGRIPGTVPPQFALLAVTTTAARSLEGKFKDDLSGASRLGEQLRESEAGAFFTFIFATNESISADLLTRMHSEAARHRFELDLWDQQRIARVLDLPPEGQWLRRRYLGIDASFLSAELLHDLSVKSIKAYAALLLTQPGELSERTRVADILNALGNSQTTLLAIAGESGFGKSTAILQALTRRLGAGDAALWLTADDVAAASSVNALLTNVLTDLNGFPIEDPSSFFRSPGGPRLLIVVDDLNRADSNAGLIRKVAQWARMVAHAPDSMPRIVFIVPLWPGIYEAAMSEDRRVAWFGTIEVSRFTRPETIEALRGTGVPSSLLAAVAEALGDDPFLVGRFRAVAAERGAGADHVALAKRVLETHLDDIERNLAALLPLADAAFVHRTFLALARNEIEHANLQPTIQEVRNWLPSVYEVLDAALRSGRLLVRRHTRDGDEIHFRHDRLHDQLLGAAMAEIIRERPDTDVIRDPFFARVTGVALTIVDDTALDRVASETPLAVFEALRVLGSRPTARRERLFEIALRWADHEAAAVPPQVRWHVLSALFDVDSSLVLRLTEAFPDGSFRRLVRLRAGDAASGAAFCGPSGSLFIFSDPRVQHAVEHAMTFHREKLVTGTAELLRSASDDRARYGALTLAGWMEAPELAHDAFACWKGAEDRDAVMPAAMWAAMRCAKEDDEEFFSALLDQILLPAPEDGQKKQRAVFHAASSYSRFASADAIRALGREARKDPRRARVVLLLLQHADDPIVFDLLLRVVAARTSTGFDVLTFALRSGWSGESKRHRRPSPASRQILEDAWQDEARSATVRREAFELWARSAADGDLEILRTFGKDSPFHQSAIHARARLRDRTVAGELAEHITRPDADGIYDVGHAASVWCRELYDVIDDLLGRADDHMEEVADCSCVVHSIIADFLVTIPANDAERLLVRHWPSLGCNGKFIHVALFIGTEQLVTLASAAIHSRLDDPKLFEHVDVRFLAFHADEEGIFTPEHLNRLLPFASRLPQVEISMMIADAARRGWREWIAEKFASATAHLPEAQCEELRKRYLPRAEELLAEFCDNAAHVYRWLRDLEQRAIPTQEALDAVRLAIAEPSVDQTIWKAACEVLEHRGTRSDITRFEPYVPDTPAGRHAFAGAAFEVRHRSLR